MKPYELDRRSMQFWIGAATGSWLTMWRNPGPLFPLGLLIGFALAEVIKWGFTAWMRGRSVTRMR